MNVIFLMLIPTCFKLRWVERIVPIGSKAEARLIRHGVTELIHAISFTVLSYRLVGHAHLNIKPLFPNSKVEVEQRETDYPNRQHQTSNEMVDDSSESRK